MFMQSRPQSLGRLLAVLQPHLQLTALGLHPVVRLLQLQHLLCQLFGARAEFSLHLTQPCLKLVLFFRRPFLLLVGVCLLRWLVVLLLY